MGEARLRFRLCTGLGSLLHLRLATEDPGRRDWPGQERLKNNPMMIVAFPLNSRNRTIASVSGWRLLGKTLKRDTSGSKLLYAQMIFHEDSIY